MASMKPEAAWARIQAAKKARKPVEDDWRDNIKFLSPGGAGNGILDLQSIETDINICHSTVRTVVPNLYFQGPDLRVEAQNPLGVESAPLTRAILDLRFRKCRSKKQFKKQIIDALVCSTGWVKAGYVEEIIEYDLPTEAEDPAVTDPLAPLPEPRVKETPRLQPMSEGPTYLTLEQGSHSTMKRVSPFDVLYDTNAEDADDENMDWIAHKVRLDIRDCRKNRKFKQGALRLLKTALGRAKSSGHHGSPGALDLFDADIDLSGAADMGPMRPIDATANPDDEFKFFGWEFWNLRDREVYIIPEEQPDVYVFDNEMPYPRHPFFGLTLTVEVPDDPCPSPVISFVKVHQGQLNSIAGHMLDYIKRAVPKWVADATQMDAEDIEELKTGGAAPFVKVKGDVTKAVQVLSGQPMNPDMHNVRGYVREEAAIASGVADFQQPVRTPGEATATEQKLQAGAVSVVTKENRDRVADVIAAVAMFMLKLEKKFTTKKQIVRIVGSSDIAWREWDKDDIMGEYDVTVVAGSQLTTEREIVVKQNLDAFNLMSPIALQGGPVNFYQLAYNVLESMGMKNIDLILPRNKMDRPPQDPYAENEFLMRGGAPEVSMNDNDQQHRQVHQELLAIPNLDPRIVYAIGKHDRDHEIQEQQKMMMMMAQQQQMVAGMPVGPGGAPGGAPQIPGQPPGPPPGENGMMGSVNGAGTGRQQPAPGQPAAPRQFAESQKGQGVPDIIRMLSRPQGVRNPS